MATQHAPHPPQAPTRRAPSTLAVVLAAASAVVVLAFVALGAVLWLTRDRSPDGGLPFLGSGRVVTQQRTVDDFTAVDLAGASTVRVRVGPAVSVEVRADEAVVGRVVTEVRDGTLVVGARGSLGARRSVEVDVSVPALESVALSGSGTLAVSGVDAAGLTVRLSGSGIVRASGTTERLTVDLPGTGSADLSALVAKEARVTVGGSGQVRVHATESLDAVLSGVGQISYSGNPASLTTKVSGVGTITAE
jgi:hypothetical protein